MLSVYEHLLSLSCDGQILCMSGYDLQTNTVLSSVLNAEMIHLSSLLEDSSNHMCVQVVISMDRL